MANWTNVPDSVLEPGDPIRSVDIIAIKDNIEHYAENNGTTYVFTSPGTWTKPATVKRIKVTVVGGGGVVRAAPGDSPTWTAGGTSSFGAFVSCTGGSATTNIAAQGNGGSATGGDINLPGARGSAGTSSPDVSSAIGAGTIFAQDTFLVLRGGSLAGNNYGGGGCFNDLSGRVGGAGAGAVAIKTIASPTIPGPVSVTVGAGGTTSGAGPVRSGNGGAGIVIVEEFY